MYVEIGLKNTQVSQEIEKHIKGWICQQWQVKEGQICICNALQILSVNIDLMQIHLYKGTF